MRIEHLDGVALLRMEAGKGNAVDADFVVRLDETLDVFDESGARALVLTGYDRFFSAGLAIPSLLPLNRDDMAAFMLDFRAVCLRLFMVSQPCIAAVNGHAIAGGLALAMQADRRIATEAPCKIGLNETRLGVGLPPVVVATTRCQVPDSHHFDVLIEGSLRSPQEALSLGIVHELVPADAVLERALEEANALAGIPAAAYSQVKSLLRRPVADRVKDANLGLERWLDCWFDPETQARLEAVAAGL